MLFNSSQFLIFFPVVTLLYFVLPRKIRWLHLLAASSIFYMAFVPRYVLILLFVISIDYIAGRAIEPAVGRRRKAFLALSILSNVGVLGFFKYFNFLNSNLSSLAEFLHWNYQIDNLGILLPLGLSFHTFQSMSYTIEVYRGNQKAERHFGMLAVYVMFYPQLVAGPIERPQNLIHQFREQHRFEWQRVESGLRLMLWGFFKKMVVADRLAGFVDQIYGDPRQHAGVMLILGSYFFAFQIYADFSGYTDIARGAARVMGFRLVPNFNRPYFATSIGEFWRRWHMSLSYWFRDYLYIPLGGNRTTGGRWLANILVVFGISGLWHGANWTFVVWGLLNGAYLLVSEWSRGIRAAFVRHAGLGRHPLVLKCLRIVMVFQLISFAWIFFRARDLTEAVFIVSHLFDNILAGLREPLALWAEAGKLAAGPDGLWITLLAVIAMEGVQWSQRNGALCRLVSNSAVSIRLFLYGAVVVCLIFLGVHTEQRFIYFDF